jgi:hypothetical protein
MDGCSMSALHVLIKQMAKLGLIFMLGASMNADAGLFGFGGTSWKEEVLLHDGQIIISERSYNLGGYPTFDSRERAALDETVTFSLPGTSKKIIWKNDFRDSVPEPNSLNLIRFDIVKGVPYIATYPAGCIAYNKWGRPNPPQVLFKYESNQWWRITLAELPAELINTQSNVVVGRPNTSMLKSFYTVEGVNAENREIDTPQYRTILRETLPNYGRSCGEMVYDGNGGWVGIDFFKDQPSYAACLQFCKRRINGAQYCLCDAFFKGAK